MHTISRSFVRRASDFTIGNVTFVAPEGKYTLNGNELPTSSVEHLLNFALQSLQDAYAGAADDADAKAKFDDKLARIVEGKLGTRTASEAVPAETRHARIILRPAVKTAVGNEAWKAADEDARIAWLDEAYAGLSAGDKATIDDMIADAIAAEKRKGGLKIAVKLG